MSALKLTGHKQIQMFEFRWESDSWRNCPPRKGLRVKDDGRLLAKLKMAAAGLARGPWVCGLGSQC